MAAVLLPAAGIQCFVGSTKYGATPFFVQCSPSATVGDLRDAIATGLGGRAIPSSTQVPAAAWLDGAELATGWDKDGGQVLGLFQQGTLVPNDEAMLVSCVTKVWGRNVLQFCIRWPIEHLRPAGNQPEEMVANWAQAFMGGDAALALHKDGSCSGWIRDPSTIADNSVHMIFKGLGTWAANEDGVSFRWIIAEHGKDSDDKNNPSIALQPMDEAAVAQFNETTFDGAKSMTWAGQRVNKFEWH